MVTFLSYLTLHFEEPSFFLELNFVFDKLVIGGALHPKSTLLISEEVALEVGILVHLLLNFERYQKVTYKFRSFF